MIDWGEILKAGWQGLKWAVIVIYILLGLYIGARLIHGGTRKKEKKK